MDTSTTQQFEFLSDLPELEIVRHEFDDHGFNLFRSSLGRVVSALRESNDQEASELSNRFRNLLFRCLAAPVGFDESFLNEIKDFGDPVMFSRRWGIPEFLSCVQAAEALVSTNQQVPNPMRGELLATIRQLRSNHVDFRIYCWPSVRPCFESVLQQVGDPPLTDVSFIHTLAAYRQARLFDTMIKVGPIRSNGISGIPESCLSAPKFRRLIQFAWTRCADEDGVGLDPANSPGSLCKLVGLRRPPTQTHFAERSVSASVTPVDCQDDFTIFNEPVSRGDKCRVCLVGIGDGDGMLLPPNAGVLSFHSDQQGPEAVSYRSISDGLDAPMYLVIPRTGGIEFGGLIPHHTHARVWKERLREMIQVSLSGLCFHLKESGLTDLKTLPARVQYWARDADENGIHAPMEMRHFSVLMKVLEKDNPLSPAAGWWRLAWREIQSSRGMAQKEGREGNQIIRDAQVELLRALLPEIRQRSNEGRGFHIPIPEDRELRGRFVFYRISGIRGEYLVPEEMAWEVVGLNDLEQWRIQ